MVRSLEVFLKLWAVCLVFFFLIAVKRELISKSNVAAVASPLYMAGSRRTDSLELYSTESQTQLDDPPGRAANMEYEVGYTNSVCNWSGPDRSHSPKIRTGPKFGTGPRTGPSELPNTPLWKGTQD